MIRTCDSCGASIPKNARSCPSCGEGPAPVAPLRASPCGKCGRPVAAQLKACQVCGAPNYGGGDAEAPRSLQDPAAPPPPPPLDLAALREGALRGTRALAFAVGLPAVLLGLLLRRLLSPRRAARVPLWLPGLLLAALSYLSFEIWEGPGTGVVFPLLLLAALSCAGLQAAGGGRGPGLRKGVALLAAGGALLHVGAALQLQRSRAPRVAAVVAELPLSLSPREAAGRPERCLHVLLTEGRLDAARGLWRTDTAAVGVFTPAEPSAFPVEAPLAEVQARAVDLLGSRVRITEGQVPGRQAWVRDGPGGAWRLYQDLGLSTSTRMFLLASGPREAEGKPEGILNLESPAGILASIPRTARDLFAAVTPRGVPSRPESRLVLVTDADPQKRCAPVEGTEGRLWVQAPGEDLPAEGTPLQGVLETPEPGALRSLELSARSLGLTPSGPPRVLVLESVAAYCSARGIPAPLPESAPWGIWGTLALGALLAAAGLMQACKSA